MPITLFERVPNYNRLKIVRDGKKVMGYIGENLYLVGGKAEPAKGLIPEFTHVINDPEAGNSLFVTEKEAELINAKVKTENELEAMVLRLKIKDASENLNDLLEEFNDKFGNY